MTIPRHPITSAAFRREYKRAIKRGHEIINIDEVMADLIAVRPLSPLRRDHALTGNWADHRECHIAGDWLLIYRIDPIAETERETKGPVESVTFVRTGTHADLFS